MTNNKQQTAVDSIIELCQELLANHYSISHDAVCSEVIKFCQEQAKQIHKEEMIKFGCLLTQSPQHIIEEAYNETYGRGEQ
jgi:hypothetical protein